MLTIVDPTPQIFAPVSPNKCDMSGVYEAIGQLRCDCDIAPLTSAISVLSEQISAISEQNSTILDQNTSILDQISAINDKIYECCGNDPRPGDTIYVRHDESSSYVSEVSVTPSIVYKTEYNISHIVNTPRTLVFVGKTNSGLPVTIMGSDGIHFPVLNNNDTPLLAKNVVIGIEIPSYIYSDYIKINVATT